MTIDFLKKNHIAYITINRPLMRNSLDRESLVAMRDILINFDQDAELRVAIISGSGNEAFCAGMDIASFLNPASDFSVNQDFPQSLMRGLTTNKPIIAAINGLALGGGLELALSCDLRISVPEAKFGFPEVTLGLIPGWGGTQRLVRQLSWCNSAELIFSGKSIDAEKARRIGLINDIAPAGELMSKARYWAEAIARAAPLAVQAAKEAMVKGSQLPFDEGLQLEDGLCTYLKTTADFTEGIKAYQNKYQANFKGV